jgi:hypothetical protein
MTMMTKTASTATSWQQVGDATHFLTMLSAVSFAIAVGRYAGDTNNKSSLFDAQWTIDGFCVAGKEQPYGNSHDACLYTDLALSAVLTGLYFLYRNTPGMNGANQYVVPQIVGQVAHGIGHGGIAYQLRALGGDSEKMFAKEEATYTERLRQ